MPQTSIRRTSFLKHLALTLQHVNFTDDNQRSYERRFFADQWHRPHGVLCGKCKASLLIFYQHCMGFELVAYAGPETGVRDRASYVLQQNKIRFVLTTSLQKRFTRSQHHVAKTRRWCKGSWPCGWMMPAKSFYETTSRGAESAGDSLKS